MLNGFRVRLHDGGSKAMKGGREKEKAASMARRGWNKKADWKT
jgi:hypothetical protein